jgi:hypothetical protein
MNTFTRPEQTPDPAFTPFVTASAEEIELAEVLRRSIEERYLAVATPADPYRCVDAD